VLIAWSSAGRLRSAQLVRDIRTAVRWSLLHLRQPLRARRTSRRPPIAVVIRLADDLRDPLLDSRLLLAKRAQLATTRLAAPLTHLVDRPFRSIEHTFVSYHHHAKNVPALC
jgi:hypothetical protein